MKDLAYLNAGAARVNSGGEVAGDVDANYDDSIDLLDLAVLDKDWGKSLHDGADNFLGSNDLSWEELDHLSRRFELRRQGIHERFGISKCRRSKS